MSDITRGRAAPARRRARLTVRVGAAGVLVLLVLSGAGAVGGDDTQSDLVDADFSRHGIDQIQIDDPQGPPENRRRSLNDIDTRVPIMEASEPTRFFEAPSSGCVFDPRYLPHTPDAVEGWYPSCRFVMSRDSGCQFNPKYLPRTSDAVEGWHRNCLSRR